MAFYQSLPMRARRGISFQGYDLDSDYELCADALFVLGTVAEHSAERVASLSSSTHETGEADHDDKAAAPLSISLWARLRAALPPSLGVMRAHTHTDASVPSMPSMTSKNSVAAEREDHDFDAKAMNRDGTDTDGTNVDENRRKHSTRACAGSGVSEAVSEVEPPALRSLRSLKAGAGSQTALRRRAPRLMNEAAMGGEVCELVVSHIVGQLGARLEEGIPSKLVQSFLENVEQWGALMLELRRTAPAEHDTTERTTERAAPVSHIASTASKLVDILRRHPIEQPTIVRRLIQAALRLTSVPEGMAIASTLLGSHLVTTSTLGTSACDPKAGAPLPGSFGEDGDARSAANGSTRPLQFGPPITFGGHQAQAAAVTAVLSYYDTMLARLATAWGKGGAGADLGAVNSGTAFSSDSAAVMAEAAHMAATQQCEQTIEILPALMRDLSELLTSITSAHQNATGATTADPSAGGSHTKHAKHAKHTPPRALPPSVKVKLVLLLERFYTSARLATVCLHRLLAQDVRATATAATAAGASALAIANGSSTSALAPHHSSHSLQTSSSSRGRSRGNTSHRSPRHAAHDAADGSWRSHGPHEYELLVMVAAYVCAHLDGELELDPSTSPPPMASPPPSSPSPSPDSRALHASPSWLEHVHRWIQTEWTGPTAAPNAADNTTTTAAAAEPRPQRRTLPEPHPSGEASGPSVPSEPTRSRSHSHSHSQTNPGPSICPEVAKRVPTLVFKMDQSQIALGKLAAAASHVGNTRPGLFSGQLPAALEHELITKLVAWNAQVGRRHKHSPVRQQPRQSQELYQSQPLQQPREYTTSTVPETAGTTQPQPQPQREAPDLDMAVDVEPTQHQTRSTKRRKRQRLRSRNTAIDGWLSEESGSDTFADLESFIV